MSTAEVRPGTTGVVEFEELRKRAKQLAAFARTCDHASDGGWRDELLKRADLVVEAAGPLQADDYEVGHLESRGLVRVLYINAEVPQGAGPQFHEALRDLLSQFMGVGPEQVAESNPHEIQPGERL